MPRKATVHIEGPLRLVQRGRYWYVHYTDEAGQRQRQSLKVSNLRVAQRKAREIADLLERGEHATLQARKEYRKLTFAELAEEFKGQFKGWGPSTWRSTGGTIRRLVREWEDLPLAAINSRLIEAFLAMRLDQEGVTTATYNRYLACLKTMFKAAVRWGIVGYNPAEKVKMLKEEVKVPKALSEDELERLVSELPESARTIAIVASETGMRRGELQNLEWADVDFDSRLITVRQSKNKAFRVIPMTQRVHKVLLEQRQKGVIPHVLVGETNKPFVDIKNSLKGAGNRAGIGHVHLHMLRHTFATRLRDRGVPLDRIMSLLGHKAMEMTLRYAKCTPVQLRDAIEALQA